MSLRLPALPLGYVEHEPNRARRALMPGPPDPEGVTALETERDHLADLMACPSFRGRLSPEDEVSYWCASELRRLTRARELRCVWSMVPGEQRQGGRLGPMHQARVQALGYVPGCPDFLFAWGTGGGGIELKIESSQGVLLASKGSIDGARKLAARKGRRTYPGPRQRDFETWCAEQGVKYAVARRWGEMRDTLMEWGRL